MTFLGSSHKRDALVSILTAFCELNKVTHSGSELSKALDA